MYHKNLSIFYCVNSMLFTDIIKNQKPLEHFTHSFSEFSLPYSTVLNDADVIICQLSDISELKDLTGNVKEGIKLIIICEASMHSEASLLLTADDELISDDTSAEEFRYRLRKFMKNIALTAELWYRETCLETMIDSVPDLIWFKDKEGAHYEVNKSFCKAVGKTKKEVYGRGHYYIWDIEPEEYANGEYICMESEFEVMDKKRTCVFDEKVRIADEMRELKTYKSPLFDLDGSVMGTVGFARDVTTENKYRRKMVDNANRDFLTGLYNRRYIYHYLEQIRGTAYTLFFLDLDHFKKVNDIYGHTEGDRALVTTKDALASILPEAVISRVGGDEFLVVKKGENAKAEIEEEVAYIKSRLEAIYKNDSSFQPLGVSVGAIYVGAASEAPVDDIINEADERMYLNKKNSRDKDENEDREAYKKKDPLTGLDRYEPFMELFANTINSLGDKKLAVIFADIKNFKSINESYGYQKGNELLIKFANKLKGLGERYVGATRLFSDNYVSIGYVPENMTIDAFISDVVEWGKNIETELGSDYGTNKLKLYAGVNVISKDNIQTAELAMSCANLARKKAKSSEGTYVELYDSSMRPE